jgi:acylphosphatase
MARTIGQTCRVTGIVQNLDDGRVLLVVEGAQPEIEGFLTRVDDEMGRYIRDRKVTTGPATGEFHDFHIRAS